MKAKRSQRAGNRSEPVLDSAAQGSRSEERGRVYTKNEVFQILTEEILSMELGPGEPLVERSLAERFGLSRTPIREILMRLESEKLVEFYPNQGAFVRALTARDVREMFQLREALEPLAVFLAAQNRPLAEVEDLIHRLPSQEEAKQLTAKQLRQLGEDIHDSIVRWSKHEMLQDIYSIIRKYMRLLRSQTRIESRIEYRSYLEHLEILEAIRAGDDKLAKRLMARHMQRSNSLNISFTS